MLAAEVAAVVTGVSVYAISGDAVASIELAIVVFGTADQALRR